MDPLDIDKTIPPDDGKKHSASLQAGFMLGQYKIIRLLGRGGMGEVYEVEHQVLHRKYALKLLPADFASRSGALERFQREAEVMANLEHRNIVRVDDFGKADGRYWLRMELVDGVDSSQLSVVRRPLSDTRIVSLEDLAEARGGKIPQEELLEILKQILAGLDYAHEHGAIHRDLKPSNILLRPSSVVRGQLSGERKTTDKGQLATDITVKVSDFGLVRLIGEEWVRSQAQISVQRSLSMGEKATMGKETEGTSTRSLLGTYEYMSPEQKRGEDADERSDIYSLGLMTFRLLTGQEEFSFELPSQLEADISEGWDEVVKRSLRPNRSERIRNCLEFRKLLGCCQEFCVRK